MDFKLPSLAARLTLSSVLVLPVILGFSAYSLDRAFRNSLINAEQQALQAHLYSLLGAAEPEDHQLYLPETMAEPRFNRPQSGLYGLVTNTKGEIVWKSDSFPADDSLSLPRRAQLAPGQELFNEQLLREEPHFVLSFDSVWEINQQDTLFRFSIIHDQHQLQEELKGYRDALWLWLGGIAILFIIAQFLITRWGLKPLDRLAQALKKFQQGHNSQLEGEYPTEIAPVIHNLNELLETEQGQRQRYKNTLSDLAHSLKTPLAIIRAELESNSPTQQNAINEQVSRMADIIQHQLQRATLTATSSIRAKTPLAATINRLSTALRKVFREKQFSVDINIPENLQFPGDESDALEVFGNILENAFKYGQNKIQIGAQTNNDVLTVSIEDNGPGIADELKQRLLTRGARADTSIQGQGIGLSIVVDILSSYQGQLEVSDSELGGAKFTLLFPI
ncbi:ATP-binding protein [Teredinibacter haidensis]|uniref:ATP-binding protein n=1 Tax=Teredinibacter haidensis TaxID=2731755 RepID=UPI000948C005|nr:ATP-binding protein [Teredinibacter haidensis]